KQAFNATVEEAINHATSQGFPVWVALGTAVAGWALIGEGRTEEGIARIRRGLTIFEGTGTRLGKTFFLLLLADVCERGGRVDEGFSLLADTEKLILETGERLYESELWRLRGVLTLHRSTPSSEQDAMAAEASFLKALAIAREHGSRSLELRSALQLARLWQT